VFNLKWSVLSAALGFVLSLLLSLVSGAGVFALIRALIFGAGFFVVGSLLYWMVKRFLPELLNVEDDGGSGLGSHVDISLEDDDASSLTAELRGGAGDSFLDDTQGGPPDGALGVEGLERLTAGGDSPEAGFDMLESGDSDGGEFSGGTALDQDRKRGYTNKNTGEKNSPADDFGFFASLSSGFSPEGGVAGPLPVKPAGSVSAVLPAAGDNVLDVLPGSAAQAFMPSFGGFDDMVAPKGDNGVPVSVAFPGLERNSTASEEGVKEFKGKEKESALAIQTILKRD
jgi:hypothetical protein